MFSDPCAYVCVTQSSCPCMGFFSHNNNSDHYGNVNCKLNNCHCKIIFGMNNSIHFNSLTAKSNSTVQNKCDHPFLGICTIIISYNSADRSFIIVHSKAPHHQSRMQIFNCITNRFIQTSQLGCTVFSHCIRCKSLAVKVKIQMYVYIQHNWNYSMEVTKHTKWVHRIASLSNLAILSPPCSNVHASHKCKIYHLWCWSVLMLKFLQVL